VYNSAVSWGDYDNDGDLDILLTGNNYLESGSTAISKLYRNNGNNSFTEQTGINLFGVQNGSVAFGDYDNDNDLDILLTGLTAGSFPVTKIYRNNGNNSFTEQIGISLIGTSYSSAGWSDLNNDGWLDILLTGQGAGSNLISKVFRNNCDNTFTEQYEIDLEHVSRGSAAWSDYDGDGDQDILLTGNNLYGSQNSVSLVYANNGDSTFTRLSKAVLPGVMNSSAAWGDYDNDGDPDILLTGYNNEGTIVYLSRIYRNNGDSTFTHQSGIRLEGVANSSAAWGDFDSDGDLDILLSGRLINGGFATKIYRNNGNSAFAEVTDISFTGVGYSSVAWGDYDNDGDIDILMTGQSAGSTIVTKIYRNNAVMKAGDYQANRKAVDPGNLTAVRLPEGIRLSWSPVRSDETPSGAMTYNINIQPEAGGLMAMAAQSDTITGYRRIVSMGNTQTDTTFLIRNLIPGKYRWKVQAVDQGYQGGVWAIGPPINAKNVQAFFDADTVCMKQGTEFNNRSTSFRDPITVYSWDFGDGVVSADEEPVHLYSSAGVHTVRLAVSTAFDSDTLIKDIYVYHVPLIDFSIDGLCEGVETVINNLTVTTGFTIDSWHWDFGDERESTVKNPGSHNYLNSGNYIMKLVAETSDGCIDSTQKSITIADALQKPDIYARGPKVWYLASSNDTAKYYRWYCNYELIDGAASNVYVANRKYGVYYLSISDNNVCYTSSDSISIPTGFHTGIEDIDPFESMNIYPNPTSGKVTVDMENQVFDDLNVTIVTIEGREVYSNKFEKATEYFSVEIDLSDRAEGVYFIKLQTGKYLATRKVIVE